MVNYENDECHQQNSEVVQIPEEGRRQLYEENRWRVEQNKIPSQILYVPVILLIGCFFYYFSTYHDSDGAYRDENSCINLRRFSSRMGIGNLIIGGLMLLNIVITYFTRNIHIMITLSEHLQRIVAIFQFVMLFIGIQGIDFDQKDDCESLRQAAALYIVFIITLTLYYIHKYVLKDDNVR